MSRNEQRRLALHIRKESRAILELLEDSYMMKGFPKSLSHYVVSRLRKNIRYPVNSPKSVGKRLFLGYQKLRMIAEASNSEVMDATRLEIANALTREIKMRGLESPDGVTSAVSALTTALSQASIAAGSSDALFRDMYNTGFELFIKGLFDPPPQVGSLTEPLMEETDTPALQKFAEWAAGAMPSLLTEGNVPPGSPAHGEPLQNVRESLPCHHCVDGTLTITAIADNTDPLALGSAQPACELKVSFDTSESQDSAAQQARSQPLSIQLKEVSLEVFADLLANDQKKLLSAQKGPPVSQVKEDNVFTAAVKQMAADQATKSTVILPPLQQSQQPESSTKAEGERNVLGTLQKTDGSPRKCDVLKALKPVQQPEGCTWAGGRRRNASKAPKKPSSQLSSSSVSRPVCRSEVAQVYRELDTKPHDKQETVAGSARQAMGSRQARTAKLAADEASGKDVHGALLRVKAEKLARRVAYCVRQYHLTRQAAAV